MNTLETNVIIAAVIGFVLGIVLMAIISRSSKGKHDEETAKLRAEYHRYREQVNAHFAKTADAVDGLTKSYQEVFDHLSHGAQNLMDKKALQAQLEKRQGKAVTLAYLVEQSNDAPRPAVSKIKASSVVGDGKTPSTPPGKKPAAPTAEAKPPKPATNSTPESKGATPNSKPDEAAMAKPAVGADVTNVKAVATNAEKHAPVKASSPAHSNAGPETTGSGMPKPKSSVHLAAEKAGLKPAKEEAADKPQAAIDQVKKHIHDDKGTRS